MKSLRYAVGGYLLLGFFGFVANVDADDSKSDKKGTKDIVGIWKMIEVDGEDAPLDISMEFTDDGKVKAIVRLDGKTGNSQGTYEIEDDKLKIMTNGKGGRNTEVLVVKKINKEKLITLDERGYKASYVRQSKSKGP
jgi:uncharacterized protein (TIGR03066 family)